MNQEILFYNNYNSIFYIYHDILIHYNLMSNNIPLIYYTCVITYGHNIIYQIINLYNYN